MSSGRNRRKAALPGAAYSRPASLDSTGLVVTVFAENGGVEGVWDFSTAKGDVRLRRAFAAAFDQFYAERAKREGVSQREVRLRESVTALEERVAALREERDNYRTSSEVFARAINVLTAENDSLRKDLAKARNRIAPPLRGLSIPNTND